ncbi:uncharacterized protein LOC62_01G001620 [Vanrija pseudolonga]|uniref:Uncharacterized protein n=1 Tax=Vanrija pseudolonga TaxID=143232 RepID=A0AAF0Y1B0_9TREE|nr:hypothetical protein LOC62_01G001620 [Vanrija pseudolonga]
MPRKRQTPKRSPANALLASATIIMYSPHLVDIIMQHAARSTLVSCLRVNRLLHNAAGKELYHTVRIHGRNAHGLFDGVEWEDHLMEGSEEDGEDEGGDEGALFNPTPRENMFKNRLLEHVRVLPIGSHSYHLCEEQVSPIENLGELLKALLRGVHTVRVVLTPKGSGLGFLCCGRNDRCEILPELSPSKVVIRNVSASAVCDFSGYWPRASLANVVWVLPTNRESEDTSQGYVTDLGDCGTQAPNVRMLFHRGFETWHHKKGPKTRSSSKGSQAVRFFVSPVHINRLLNAIKRLVEPHDVPVYGLERVKFVAHPSDPLVQHYRSSFPYGPLESDDLRKLAVDEFMKPVTNVIGADSSNSPYAFKTLAEYAALDADDARFDLDDEYRR